MFERFTSWLYSVSWTGLGIAPQTWAIIMIAVASVVGFLMALTRKDAAYLFLVVLVLTIVSTRVVNQLRLSKGVELEGLPFGQHPSRGLRGVSPARYRLPESGSL